jgi:acetyl esterase/lipase
LGDLVPEDPRISPLFAEFPNCPPVLMQVSESEILRDDSRRMAEKLRATGADAGLQEWPEAPHVWHILDGWVPEARQALRQIADFIAAQG